MSADSSEIPTPEESGERTPDDRAPGSAPTPQPHSDSAGHWIPPSLEHLQGLLPTYEFIEILGYGGMGAVYKARQLSLDRLVAIKILPPGIAAAGETSFVERFKNEARTMAKMNHPGIVNVYDFGQTAEGQLYLVMEYIDGTDVAKMVHSQGRLPPDYALAIAAHVCDALQYAHTHGVIHRDIKPANVLINMEGQVKVADFGLAKAKTRGAQSTALTDTNMTMGTPDYVAPEALMIGMEPDHRADLYAMGVMLYNMLTGEIPRGRFKPASEKTGGDPRFDIIINKAMQERDARYQTALNMRRDLDVILTVPLAKSDATSSAIPKQFAQQNAIRKPVARRPSPVHATPPPPPQKSGALWGIIIIALLAAGGFFGWKQFSKPNSTAGESDHLANPAATGDAEQQLQQVVAELKKLNPDYDGAEKHSIEHGVVTAFHMDTTHVSNIAPLAALKGLRSLECAPPVTPGDSDPGGRLQDIGPLRGLQLAGLILRFNRDLADFTPIKGMPLESLHVGLTKFHDFDLLRGMPLKKLQIYRTPIHDLSALQGMALTELTFDETPVSDLAPLKGMSLTKLHFRNTQVTDLTLLREMPLKDLLFNVNPARDYSLLASLKTLEILNDKPAADWFKNQPAPGLATSTAYPQPPTWTDCTQVLQAQSSSIVADGEWLSTTNKVSMPTLAPGKTFQNPIVRVRYSGRVDIALRRQHLGGEDVRYEAGIGATGASLDITRVNGGRLAPAVKLGPSYRSGEEHEAVFAAQGSIVSLWIDGQNVTAVQDSTLSSGQIALLMKNDSNGNCRIKKVEYGELPDAVITTGNPTSPTTAAYPQPTKWNDATADLRQRYEGSGDFVADGAWFRTTAKSKMFVFAPGQEFRNPIMRIHYSHRLDLALRRTRKGADDLYYNLGIGPNSVYFSVTQPAGAASVPLLPLTKLDPSFQPDEEHEAVFAGQGSTLTLWIDGRKILTTQDSTLASGGLAILMKSDAQYGDCRIKQVEYGELPETVVTTGNQVPIAVTSPLRETPVEGPWTNVLPLVQLPRDLSEEKPAEGAVPQSAADWRLDDGVLSATKGGHHAIISPDLALPESYDLSLHVKASSGKSSSAGVIVPVGGHHMMVFFQLFNFEMSGLEVIDGKIVPSGGLTTIRPAVLHENVEQLVEISVRSHSGDASVTLKVDGKPVVDWTGKETSISLFWQWSGRVKTHRLGLCADVAGATVHDVRVRRTVDGVIATTAPDASGDVRIFNGHRYQLVLEKALAWTDAKLKAEKMGGHLATITSREKDDWIIASFGQVLKTRRMGVSFWLGASRATTGSDWQWVTGEPFKFTSWGHGEPNATPGEGAPIGLAYAYGAEIYKGGVGWNDIPPHVNAAWGPEASIGYLVEWDAPQVAAVATLPAPAAAEKWTDWLADQRRGGKLPPGLVEDGNGYKVTIPKFLAAVGPTMKDGAIRVIGSRRSAPSFHLLLRCVNPNPNYYKKAGLNSYAKTYRLQDRNGGIEVDFREASASGGMRIGDLDGPSDSSKSHVMELRMAGNVLTATYDGKQLLNTRDTRIMEGQPAIFAAVGAYFEKIEVLDLDGPRLPPLLLSQYAAALTRERDAAHPEEKGAYNVELARLKTDPTLPLVDAPGTSDAVAKLRKKARALLGKRP